MVLSNVAFKLISMAAIFVACFLGGILPLRFSKWFGEKSLHLSNCAAAGILMGAALVHLLFDAEQGKPFEYPLGHFLCGVGFFLAFFLEKILFNHHHDHPEHKHSVMQVPHHKLHSMNEDTNPHPHGHHHDELHHRKQGHELEEITQEESDRYANNIIIDNNTTNTNHIAASTSNPPNTELLSNHPHHTAIPWVLFSVLSLESFISGSALGVQENFLGTLVTFIAIITHIWAESFALTANVLKSPVSNATVYKMVLAFSSVTPIGIGLGMLLLGRLSGEAANLASDSLIALASGTFLFISTMEIMAEEFESNEDKWPKLILMLLGFFFMCGLAIWL